MSRPLIMTILLLALIVFFQLQLKGQEKDKISPDLYVASTIPDSLLQNSESVLRYKFEEHIVQNAGKSTMKQRSVTTILNEKGDHEAEIGLPYDKKFSSVAQVEVSFYAADGKLIKRYRKNDMYDHVMYDGISILTDSRILLLKHDITSYPVTMDLQIVYNSNGYINLASWDILKPKQSVQYSAFKVSVLPEVGIRFKNHHTTIQPQKATENGLETFTWEVRNKKALLSEVHSQLWSILPRVDVSPKFFEFDNKAGSFESWTSYGKWQRALNADISSLTPAREEEIRQMTNHLKGDKEKAKFLYEYLQKNMRYVSIQLGIGGLKPFPATFVDEKKYGDCKALSNYMHALLKAVNIPSYYCEINAGENEEPANPSFVKKFSNHIILCVPFKNDTTWLECTSNTNAFGELGTFTENRYALMVTEDGGKLVRTPASLKEKNIFEGEAKIQLSDDGSAIAKLSIKATGEFRDTYIGNSHQKIDDQKSFFIKSLYLKQPDLLDIKYVEDKEGLKNIELEIEYSKLSEMATSDKFFYRPHLIDIWKETYPVIEQRKTDFYFAHPFIKSQTTEITIPENFEAETIPQNVSLKFSFGSYESSYEYDAARKIVKSTSKFVLEKHVIPAAKFSEMQQFLEAVSKSLNKKLVVRKEITGTTTSSTK